MIAIVQWRCSIGSWSNCHHLLPVYQSQQSTSVSNYSSLVISSSSVIMCYRVLIALMSLILLSGDIESNPGPSLTGQKPVLNDVHKLLKYKSAKWQDIGCALGVDKNFRETLQMNTTKYDNTKLEDVLQQWIESECSEVSWDNLIHVLKEDLHMVDIACNVEKYLLNDPAAVTKYNWESELKKSDTFKQFASTSDNPLDHRPLDSCQPSLISYTQPPIYLNQPQQQPHPPTSSQIHAHTAFPSGRHIPASICEQKHYLPTPQYNMPQPSRQGLELYQPHVHSHEIEQIILNRYKHHLIGYYTRSKLPSYFKYPSPAISEFINLAAVQKQSKEYKKQKHAVMNYKIYGKLKDIKREKKSISISEIAKGDKLPRFVLVEGDPGVGKTTLVWELCKRWAGGSLLKEWSLVILVQLREKSMREADSIQSMVDPTNEYPGIAEYMKKTNGKDLLLAFDGFDELSDKQQERTSLFSSILDGKLLSNASIIVTSRPSATHLLPSSFFNNLSQHIEVLGFEDKDINRYIECKFREDQDILDSFKSYISCHHFIFTLMYVPLHCALVTDLYEVYLKDEGKEFAPKTLTQLYTCFICCLLQRHLEDVPQYRGHKVEQISDLPPDIYSEFMILAEIAARGIENKQYIFDDVKCSSLGLLQRASVRSQSAKTSASYSFLHLTLQEYLAAFYWTKQSSKILNQLFTEGGALPAEDYFRKTEGKAFHWPALHFYSGLTGVVNTPLEEILTTNKSTKYNFMCLLFESQDINLVSLVFTEDVECIADSFMKAYVIGYSIARSSESVKWSIDMYRNSYMQTLVHGIDHAKIPDKGGKIVKLTIKEGSYGDDHAFIELLNLLEKIQYCVKNFKLRYEPRVIFTEFRVPPSFGPYTFDLVEFDKGTMMELDELRWLINCLFSFHKTLKIWHFDIEDFRLVYTNSGMGIKFCDPGRIHLHDYNNINNNEPVALPFFSHGIQSLLTAPNSANKKFLPVIAAHHEVSGLNRARCVGLFPEVYSFSSTLQKIYTFFQYHKKPQSAITDSSMYYKINFIDHTNFYPVFKFENTGERYSVLYHNQLTDNWFEISFFWTCEPNMECLYVLVTPEVEELLVHQLEHNKLQSIGTIGDSAIMQTLVKTAVENNPGIVVNDRKIALDLYRNGIEMHIMYDHNFDSNEMTSYLPNCGGPGFRVTESRDCIIEHNFVKKNVYSLKRNISYVRCYYQDGILEDLLKDNISATVLDVDESQSSSVSKVLAEGSNVLEVIKIFGRGKGLRQLLSCLSSCKKLRTLVIETTPATIAEADEFIKLINITEQVKVLLSICVSFEDGKIMKEINIHSILSAAANKSSIKEIIIEFENDELIVTDGGTVYPISPPLGRSVFVNIMDPSVVDNIIMKSNFILILFVEYDTSGLKEHFSSAVSFSTKRLLIMSKEELREYEEVKLSKVCLHPRPTRQ